MQIIFFFKLRPSQRATSKEQTQWSADEYECEMLDSWCSQGYEGLVSQTWSPGPLLWLLLINVFGPRWRCSDDLDLSKYVNIFGEMFSFQSLFYLYCFFLDIWQTRFPITEPSPMVTERVPRDTSFPGRQHLQNRSMDYDILVNMSSNTQKQAMPAFFIYCKYKIEGLLLTEFHLSRLVYFITQWKIG